MEESILNTTKKILGIAPDYTAFDLDVIVHINSAFNTLTQLGVGPAGGFMIEDKNATWSDFTADDVNLNQIKTYLFLRVKLAFDPPATSFHIEALREQVKEHEWRLNVHGDPAPDPQPQSTLPSS